MTNKSSIDEVLDKVSKMFDFFLHDLSTGKREGLSGEDFTEYKRKVNVKYVKQIGEMFEQYANQQKIEALEKIKGKYYKYWEDYYKKGIKKIHSNSITIVEDEIAKLKGERDGHEKG